MEKERLYYGRSSTPKKFYSREEYIALIQEARNYYKEKIINEKDKHIGGLLLDSSLISQTSLEKYSLKVVSFGSYSYVYRYLCPQIKKDSNLVKMKDKKVNINKFFIEKDDLIKQVKQDKEIKNKNILKEIDIKNINRSKFQLQMLVKANEDKFKTFITLTFEENVKDIESANTKFNIFRTKIKRIKKDFMYVGVPEFTKNGRVHYHLLTNIDYHDWKLINENFSYFLLLEKMRTKNILLCSSTYKNLKNETEEKNAFGTHLNDFPIVFRIQNGKLENTKKTYNYKSKSVKIFKTIRYWNEGFSNIIDITDINIVGYLTKYLTKDIDNRLFGKRRYFYSLNLVRPSKIYIDLESGQDVLHFLEMATNSDVIYENLYFDKLGQAIFFTEFKRKADDIL